MLLAGNKSELIKHLKQIFIAYHTKKQKNK